MPPAVCDSWRAVVAKTCLLLASLLVVEAGLQVAAAWSPQVRRALSASWEIGDPFVPDDRLGHRGNPDHPGHDAAGYRNPRHLRQVDIVVFGDSNAYGSGVPDGAEWPQVLARLTGRNLYNMAVPGYSPAHSLFQLDNALALRPRTLILALYFGNDLFDCFVLNLRHPTLSKVAPSSLREAAAVREEGGPLKQEMELLLEVLYPLEHVQRARPSLLRAWLSSNSMLYRLLRAVKDRVVAPAALRPLLSRDFAVAAAALTPAQRPFAWPFDGEGWRTILRGPYHQRTLDDRDPRIRLGFEILKQAVIVIAGRARAASVRVVVVLLPTKESVFWPRVQARKGHAALRPTVEMVENEDRFRRQLIAYLVSHRIEYVDVLQALRAAPGQPYFEDTDSHPNSAGHDVIARAVARTPALSPTRLSSAEVKAEPRSPLLPTSPTFSGAPSPDRLTPGSPARPIRGRRISRSAAGLLLTSDLYQGGE